MGDARGREEAPREDEQRDDLRRVVAHVRRTGELGSAAFDERLHALRNQARDAADHAARDAADAARDAADAAETARDAATLAADEQQHWQLLLDAVVGMSDLGLEALLDRIVETAALLADARYSAIGILDEGEQPRLGRFVTCGMDEDDLEAIGALPEGRGVLRLVVEQNQPLRLRDLTAHPAASGFPPGHPPMRSFLGVPVRIRDQVFGGIYLTEKRCGDEFTAWDESIVKALAAAAGAAIENARFHEKALRRERWLLAAVDLTRMLLEPDSEVDALQIVADRVRELAAADLAWVVEVDDGRFSLAVVSGMPVSAEALAEVDMSRSLSRDVLETGVPMSIEDLASDPRALDVGERLGADPLGRAVLVPLRADDGVEGVVALAWRRSAGSDPDTDPSLPMLFAEQATLALHVARARREQERLAVLEDRDRIARDLHDLVIQRLFAIGLGLQGASKLRDPTEVSERLDRAVHDIDDRIRDIRHTVFALGASDSSGDVRVGVVDVVDRVAVALKFRPVVRFEGPVGYRVGPDLVPDLLAVLTEALSNVARHARATACVVELSVRDGVRLTVSDDGIGLPSTVIESGLANLRRRAEDRGGSLTISSGNPSGTTLVWWIPAP
jgi:signal transduction histidine kinase